MKVNSFYVLVLLLVGALVFITTRFFDGGGKSWVGVAAARAYNISSEKQATVYSLRVVQGQAIKAGDTLIVLISKELLQQIGILRNRIEVLQSEKIAKQNLFKSEIELHKSTNHIDVSQLNQQIKLAESELSLNKSLTSNSNKDQSNSTISPLEEKIKLLNGEILLRNQTLDIRIQDLMARNSMEQDLIQNQIGLLSSEINFLIKQKDALIKVSNYDGVVETILVKPNEEVDAYTNLLSILPKNPSSVVGYLEARKTPPAIGTKVQILGYEARWKTLEGKVIGYGSIIPLPDILQKSTAVKAFGKEIFIEIPAQNSFSTGEKLLVRIWEK